MIRRILIAVDAGNDSLRAEALAAEFAKGLGAEVTVLHVRVWLLGPAGPFDDGKQQTADLLRRVAERLQAQGLRVQNETRSTYFAFTARRIADVAREDGADLIVLGARRRASLIRSLLGADVTSGVLRHATVPVLVATSDGSSSAGRTGLEVSRVAEQGHSHQVSERAHRGTFAEGLAQRTPHPERWPRGDFAMGLRSVEGSERMHQGTFAEGLAHERAHPELSLEGDFAHGQRPTEFEP